MSFKIATLKGLWKRRRKAEIQEMSLIHISSRISVESGFFDPFYTCVLEKKNKYESILNKKYQETMIKSIMASEQDFDETYDNLVEEYMSIGAVSYTHLFLTVKAAYFIIGI